MAGRLAAELAKLLDVVERQVIAGKIERSVQQHRAVPGRQHETVAAKPFRILRVMAHEARKQQVSDRRHTHRHSGVARIGLLDSVDREYADRVDAKLVETGIVRVYFGCSCHRGSIQIAITIG